MRSSEWKGEKQGTELWGLHMVLKHHGQLREIRDDAENGNQAAWIKKKKKLKKREEKSELRCCLY